MKIIIISFVLLLTGCVTSDDVNCVPIHIGTGYDDNGMLMTIRVEEPGCPRIDTYENFYGLEWEK